MEKKQSSIDLIFDTFNLLSDYSFRVWMLNNYDELKAMHKEEQISFAKKCLDKALDLDVRTAHSKVEEMYNEKFGGNNDTKRKG